jgi:hypothetical protein
MIGAKRSRRVNDGKFYYVNYSSSSGNRVADKDLPFNVDGFASGEEIAPGRNNYIHLNSSTGPGFHGHSSRFKAHPLCVRWNMPEGMTIDEWAKEHLKPKPKPEPLTDPNLLTPTKTPTDGKEPAKTPTDGKEPAKTPTDGKEPAKTPTDGKEPAKTPTDGKEPAKTPTDGKRPVCAINPKTKILNPDLEHRQASSTYSENIAAHGNSMLNIGGAWCAKHKVPGEWLQLDAGKAMEVSGVVLQGRNAHGHGNQKGKDYQWAKQIKVTVSLDGDTWSEVDDGKIF